jgi:DNA-binding CsgD family transcriptional regulator
MGDGMPEPLLAFDRTLVMDSLALTGMVLCDLADEAAGRPCSELLPSLSALYERLVALRASQPEARVLIITELLDQQSSLQEGIAMLDALQGLCQGALSGDGVHGADRPASAEGGREPQSVSRGSAPGIAGRTTAGSADGRGAWPDTVMSPAVTEGLMLTREVNLTPHELECLVTQADGLGLKTSAKVMNISYRTVAAYRQNLSKRSDQGRQMTFSWRIAQMQKPGDPAAGMKSWI